MNDLHLKPSDAVDHGKEKEMSGGNWSNSSFDSYELNINSIFLVPAHRG